ncbi:MAG: aminotransferase class I/II-fold pyridoxal phosphate-dependent enzyme [Gammaproteobacteria bacterium]|nr:aminotransferase class I/II-fold pyridoxal phosphate-dependent enzyme [Gammaproteobacteria bacterium]
MSAFRPEIEVLRNNGITGIALQRINDPTVIPLWFGEGDRVTPGFIREAAKQALDDGLTFYNHTRGRIELRSAIKRYLDQLYGLDLNPDRVSVPGSTMLGITIAAQMCLNKGDHSIIVSPNWPNIESTFQVTGAQVCFVRQRQEGGEWQLELSDLYAAVQPNTRAIFINTPCNPTGWVMTPDEQREVLEFCRRRQIVLIADEVYHRTVYDAPVAPSFLSHATDDDPVVVVNGFSKAWAMTGWRIGWVVAPARMEEQWAVMSECFNTGATTFAQLGALAAIEQGEATVKQLTQQYAKGRDIVMEMLGQHPRLEILRPQGAFYAFPRLRGVRSSMQFAQQVLDEENVGLAPGYTFGPGNEEHFRLCFAQSHERLREALRRVLACMDRLPDSAFTE